MFRPKVHSAISIGACLRLKGSALAAPGFVYSVAAYQKASSNGGGTPPEYPRTIASKASQNNKNSQQTSPPPSGDPTDASTKPQREFRSYGITKPRLGGAWGSVLDPDPFFSAEDVRCLGPLLEPCRVELDADREVAKKQWSELCDTHVLKQKLAMSLWDRNRELEAQCRNAGAEHEKIRKQLSGVSAAREEVEAENARLRGEIRHLNHAMRTRREDTMARRDTELDKMRDRCLYQQGEMDKLRQDRNGIRYWACRLGMGLPLLMLLNMVFPQVPSL
ncbi:hypothetical protein F5Y14DRAFT_287993 [Nemania sp. NC0429]|nr:hypothetical protein F5Y14DRAFT_287993 [Nemania sp. NC0429]